MLPHFGDQGSKFRAKIWDQRWKNIPGYDPDITTYWRLKSEPVVENFAPFLLIFSRSKQKFKPSKRGHKCKLLCRLKDKGKRYSTLESTLSKSQGRTRIERCKRCNCVRTNHAIIFLKKFWTILFYFTCFVDVWNLRKLYFFFSFSLCQAPIYGEGSPYFVNFFF